MIGCSRIVHPKSVRANRFWLQQGRPHSLTALISLVSLVQVDDSLPQEVHRAQVPRAGPPEGRGSLHRQEGSPYIFAHCCSVIRPSVHLTTDRRHQLLTSVADPDL